MNVPVFALVWFAFRNLDSLPSTPADTLTLQGSTTMRDTLKSRTVWTLAIFLMLYVGAEDSM